MTLRTIFSKFERLACATESEASDEYKQMTGRASDTVKAESSGGDPRATAGLVSNLPHPQVIKTKQHTHTLRTFQTAPRWLSKRWVSAQWELLSESSELELKSSICLRVK